MGIIKIGKITSAAGLKGEVKIISYSDDPVRFEMPDHIFMYPKENSRKERPDKDGSPLGLSRKVTSKDLPKDQSGDTSDEPIVEYYIENIRYKGIQPILKLEGIDDRNTAEALRGTDIFMDEEDLPELEEGQFYVRDITGFDVVTEEGRMLGRLKDVLTVTAQDLYIVAPCKDAGREKDIMIPGVPEFILDIDTDKESITVKLPEGLMDI